MKILGTKYFGHDSAIAYIDTEKETVFAMSTERVTRIKHDWVDVSVILNEYKLNDFEYCCHSFSNFDSDDNCIETKGESIYKLKSQNYLRKVVKPKYVKDFPRFDGKNISYYIYWLRKTIANPLSMLSIIMLKRMFDRKYLPSENEGLIRKYISETSGVDRNKVKFYDHHLCHAVSAYFTSPYNQEECISLTLDGQGDGAFSKAYLCNNNSFKEISCSRTIKFTHDGKKCVTSIGEIYGNFTEALGLRRNSDEGKVEAMAAFEDKDTSLYSNLFDAVNISENGFEFDLVKVVKFYDYKYLKNQIEILGDKVFSASIQSFLEDVVVEYLNIISEKYPSVSCLCLSGGVAANIIMSLNIYERTRFKNIYVMPAMADDGTALGSAILCALDQKQDVSWLRKYYMPYYGDEITKNDVETIRSSFNQFVKFEWIGSEWYLDAAREIVDDKIISLVNGRMEFGPRALGNRTIAANATNPEIKDRINSTVKRRPSYQPFCPSILEEERERLFESSFPHKHMAIAFRIKEQYRAKLPSGIHVDGTARPQFIEEKDNPDYYKMIKEIKKLTGFGVVIDTSFNLHGRTIVRTAEDALVDFIDCNIDFMYIAGFKVSRR